MRLYAKFSVRSLFDPHVMISAEIKLLGLSLVDARVGILDPPAAAVEFRLSSAGVVMSGLLAPVGMLIGPKSHKETIRK